MTITLPEMTYRNFVIGYLVIRFVYAFTTYYKWLIDTRKSANEDAHRQNGHVIWDIEETMIRAGGHFVIGFELKIIETIAYIGARILVPILTLSFQKPWDYQSMVTPPLDCPPDRFYGVI